MRSTGPFDRVTVRSRGSADGLRIVIAGIVVFGIILVILIAPPVSILSRGNSGEPPVSAIGARARSNVPDLPDGYEPLSRLYDIVAPKNTKGPALVTVNLETPTNDARNLSLYSYRNGKWERIASTTLVDNGAAAQSDVAELPSNVAILRRVGVASQLSGWLPARTQPYESALPALSVLSPVDFTPGGDGSVIGDPSQRPPGQFSYIPVIRASGLSETEAVNVVLGSADLRTKHITQIQRLVETNKYDGIEIDYRDINPSRAQNFSVFLSLLAEELHKSGRKLVMTIPTPNKRGNDWDTGAYDMAEIAKSADLVKVLPERDGDNYFRRMDEVLTYLTTQIDPNKIMLVVSPYSYERGGDGLRAMTAVDALAIPSTPQVASTDVAPGASVTLTAPNLDRERGGTGLHWDDTALAVTFDYPGQGGARRVWIENSLSLGFKLQLVSRYKLAGVALEDLNKDSGVADVWPTLVNFLESGTPDLLQPNSALLQPLWTATNGNLDDKNRTTVNWKAPDQAGPYDVILIVSDGIIRVGQRVNFNVRLPGSSATPTRTPVSSPTTVR